jgi:hypothetical protein
MHSVAELVKSREFRVESVVTATSVTLWCQDIGNTVLNSQECSLSHLSTDFQVCVQDWTGPGRVGIGVFALPA